MKIKTSLLFPGTLFSRETYLIQVSDVAPSDSEKLHSELMNAGPVGYKKPKLSLKVSKPDCSVYWNTKEERMMFLKGYALALAINGVDVEMPSYW